MKVKDKKVTKQFVQALDAIFNAGQYCHPLQVGVFNMLAEVAPEVTSKFSEDVLVCQLEMDVIDESEKAFQPQSVFALNALVHAGILLHAGFTTTAKISVAFMPLQLIYLAELLMCKDAPLSVSSTVTLAQLLPFLSAEALHRISI